jgi:nucleoid-associated protein YgaU
VTPEPVSTPPTLAEAAPAKPAPAAVTAPPVKKEPPQLAEAAPPAKPQMQPPQMQPPKPAAETVDVPVVTVRTVTVQTPARSTPPVAEAPARSYSLTKVPDRIPASSAAQTVRQPRPAPKPTRPATQIPAVHRQPLSPSQIPAVVYVVTGKEGLMTIARQYYGSENVWYFPLIYYANRTIINNPDSLQKGTNIIVPDLDASKNNTVYAEQIKDFFRQTADYYYRTGRRPLGDRINSIADNWGA